MSVSGKIRPFDYQLSVLQQVADAVLIVVMLLVVHSAYVGIEYWSDRYTVTAVSAVLFFYVAARANHLYQSYRLAGIEKEFRPLLLTWVMTLGGLLVAGYVFKATHELSRVVLGVWALGVPVMMVSWRHVVRKLLMSLRAGGQNTRSVLVVGHNRTGRALSESILNHPWLGLNLIGFVQPEGLPKDEEEAGSDDPGAPVLDVETLYRMSRSGEVDLVYIALPASSHDTIEEIIRELGKTTVSIFIVPDVYVLSLMQGDVVTVGDIRTVTVIDNPTQGVGFWIKRVEDVIVSMVAILLFAIPMAIIAIGVKLSSPGPVLYRQRRYGFNGKPIEVLKFRTMRVSEGSPQFEQVKRQDPRVTRFGAFLRRTSLDELPQFLNALRGDMSIVGPRPHAEEHNEFYRDKISGYMFRHKVKPGITGLAQVNGLRGATETDEMMEQRLKLDVEYINQWSLWLDLVIILRTPFTLLNDQNAY